MLRILQHTCVNHYITVYVIKISDAWLQKFINNSHIVFPVLFSLPFSHSNYIKSTIQLCIFASKQSEYRKRNSKRIQTKAKISIRIVNAGNPLKIQNSCAI